MRAMMKIIHNRISIIKIIFNLIKKKLLIQAQIKIFKIFKLVIDKIAIINFKILRQHEISNNNKKN
jgi:hypothetical protein